MKIDSMDKVQKIREEVVRLKSQLLRGACSSQIAMETRCKEEAYDEVITLLDSMQEEHDRIVNQCIYGKEPELVDVDDLPVVVDAPPEDYVKGFADGRLYEQRQKSETSVWHDASEKPKKKCMFASDNFNDEDRKVTCGGCEEECIEKIKEERKRDLSLWSLEDFENNFFEIIKPYKDSRNYKNLCIRLLVWRSELWRWIHWKKRKEETVSEDLNTELDKYIKEHFTIDKEQIDRFGLEEKDYMYSMDKSDMLILIRHFANWQKEKDNLSVSKDMETASKEWLRPQLDKSYEPYGENKMMELTRFDGYAMLDAFEAGAHYQKKKDEKWLADNHKQIYNNGYEECYHQAEKDLELTVDDIMKIDALLIEMWNQSGNKYREVLKRFKDFKESEEK